MSDELDRIRKEQAAEFEQVEQKERIAEFEQVCKDRASMYEKSNRNAELAVLNAERRMSRSAGTPDFQANLKSYMTARINYALDSIKYGELDSRYNKLLRLIFSKWDTTKEQSSDKQTM